MRRLTLLLATALVAATVIGSAVAASAATSAVKNVKPSITAQQVTFTIPDTPTGTWRLRLTNTVKPKIHLGLDTGTMPGGELIIKTPQTLSCSFQADVSVQTTPGGPFVLYSFRFAVVPGCGEFTNGGDASSTGFWAAPPREAVVTDNLPLFLGDYEVATYAQAKAVFNHSACALASNCLADQLLAAKLNVLAAAPPVVLGSSQCIVGVIFQADQLLIKMGYMGPPGVADQGLRHAAIALKDELEAYNTSHSPGPACPPGSITVP